MGAFALRVLPVCFLFLLVPASLTLAGQNCPLVRNGDFRLQHGNCLDIELWGENGNLVLRGTRDELVNFQPEPVVKKTLVELPIIALFKTDPDKVSLDQKWYRKESMPDGWGSIQLDDFWTRQEPYTNYRGVGWYRVKFQMPAEVREAMKEALAPVYQVIGPPASSSYDNPSPPSRPCGPAGNQISYQLDYAIGKPALPSDAQQASATVMAVNVKRIVLEQAPASLPA